MGKSAILPDDFDLDLVNEIHNIHSKSQEITEVTDQLANPFYKGFVGQCGMNETDVAKFHNGADQLHNFSHHLYDGFRVFETEILSCSTMNPIYSSLMHDGKIPIEF